MTTTKTLSRTLAISLVFFLVVGCSDSNKQSDRNKFPTRTNVQVYLPDDEAEIIASFVVKSEDGTYDQFVFVEYRDGVSEKRTYRANQTIRELVQLYPASLGLVEGNRKPKRTMLFDKDGKTVLFERVTRPDGTVEVNGSRRADGYFRREFFFADGKKLQYLRIVAKNGDIVVEQEYRPNGRIARVMQSTGYGGTVTEIYREDGSLEYVEKRGPNEWDSVEKHFYDTSNRKTLEVTYTSSSISVKYYEDGKVVEERSVYNYGYGSSGSAHVYTNDKDGKRITKYYSGEHNGDWTDISGYDLKTVTETGADGKDKRIIEFYDDQRTPKVIKYPDGPGSIYKTRYKHYRPDGTLEREYYKEDYKTTKDEKEYTVEDNIREEIPEHFFERSKRKSPELLKVMPANHPGCEYCGGEGCEYCYD